MPLQGIFDMNRRLYSWHPLVTACWKSVTDWMTTRMMPDVTAAVFKSSEWVRKAMRGGKEPDIVAAAREVCTL